jgi:hypothetical protein
MMLHAHKLLLQLPEVQLPEFIADDPFADLIEKKNCKTNS